MANLRQSIRLTALALAFLILAGWTFGITLSLAASSWNGTWKLNVSKSSIPGPSFSLALAPDGKYRVENDTSSYTFGCDEKEYQISQQRTVSCKLDGSSMNLTFRANGKIVRNDHWELTAGGSKMTHTSSEPQADGSTKSNSNQFVRASGSFGFVGGWTNAQRLESHPQLVLTLDGSRLHLVLPEVAQSADVTLDGSDSPMHGANGITVAIRPNGANEFAITKKFDGKVVNQGYLRLSADGRSLVESYWSPSRPDKRAVLVYDKQ
jgi:hypothetical protein